MSIRIVYFRYFRIQTYYNGLNRMKLVRGGYNILKTALKIEVLQVLAY